MQLLSQCGQNMFHVIALHHLCLARELLCFCKLWSQSQNLHATAFQVALGLHMLELP